MESRDFGVPPVDTLQYSNGGLGIRLVEGSLNKTGKLNVYALVQYGKQQPWKSAVSTRSGNKPKWNDYHVFDSCSSDEVVLTLFDKGYVFGDSEIGRCTLSLADIRQDHFTEWWPVVAQDGSMVGQLLLTFSLPHEDSSLLTTHPSQQSVDFSEDFLKRLADIKTYKEEPVVQSRPEDVEHIRTELIKKNLKMRQWDAALCELFEAAKVRSAKIKQDKADIDKESEELQRRERMLLLEEQALEQERAALQREREELTAFRAQLSHDVAKLKQERQKLQLKKGQIEDTSKEIALASRSLHKQRLEMKRAGTRAKRLGE